MQPSPLGQAPGSPSGPLLTKTRLAIETLQEELTHAKKENEKLKKTGEAKAQQLRELQQEMEAQANRLSGLDTRLAQGQGALSAACTAASSKEAQMKALKESVTSKENTIREQAATIVGLERRVAEAETSLSSSRERENALEQERFNLSKIIQEMKDHAATREAEARQQSQAMATTGDNLRAQFQSAQAELQEERSLRQAEQNKHISNIASLEERLKRTEGELQLAKQQSAAASAEGAAGAASLRGMAEQVLHERSRWEIERSRLLQECQARLEEAEKWMAQAAVEADNQKRAAATAIQQSSQQIQLVESDLARRMEESVAAARREERQKVQAEQEASAAQHAQMEVERLANERIIEEKVKELALSQQDAMAADYEKLQSQVERCLEAVAEKVAKHQCKSDKRQGKNN